MTTTEKTAAIFWADALADQLLAQRQNYLVASGITPSGEIHVGNLREILTAQTVSLAVADRGKPVDFVFVADNMDPLRRVYPFLDASVYEKEVGRPLCQIPCPCGKHASYSEHFLEPFLASIAQLGMKPKVIGADTLYQRADFAPIIIKALEGRDRIATILHDQTGKNLEASWSPYNPQCQKCRRITGTKVLSFDAKAQTVRYSCDCGDQGEVNVIGGGKLTWRVDWPARWCLLGVTMEPFGKDHGTRGGSYDTGKIISKEIFGYEPPVPLIYEWISLKGQGDMSSSKGNVLSVHEMLQVLPPDILRYFILRVNPMKSLTLDPGLPLINLIDDFDHKQSATSDRAIALSRVGGFPALGVPFRHLTTLVQIFGDDPTKVQERLHSTGYHVTNLELLGNRMKFALNWLERFAPEEVKFSLQKELPPAAREIGEKQRQALKLIAARLKPAMDPEVMHQMVYGVKEELQMNPVEVFEAIYLALLGKKSGPRVGLFLSVLDSHWVQKRLSEV